jgi:transposase
MRDTDLYAQILGVQSPWSVDCVDFLKESKEVRITVSLDKSGYACPVCGKPCSGYDSSKRRWRHLDTCQYATFIESDVPRIECEEHGIRSVNVPWAEAKSRFTILFERLVIDLLHDASISVVADWTGLSWSQVDGIQSRAVARGLARRKTEPVQDIGVDETSAKKGHNYLTIVHDKASGNVLYVGENRDMATIDRFYEEWQDHLWAVRSVSMDLWPAFIGSARKWLDDADSKICFDRFHVAGFFGKAVDLVRRAECRELKADGNDMLKGTKFDWLRNGNNLDGRSRRWFNKLTRENLKTARAWAIKETAARLWSYTSRTWAEKVWGRLIGWMWRSRLAPMIALAKSLKKHFYGIMNAIILGVDNGMAESINSKIQKVKKMACGFRNTERFKNAIIFHFGGLDLYPALPTQ